MSERNLVEIEFRMNVNKGGWQTLEGGCAVDSWRELKDHLMLEISSLIDMNEGMGLIDWKD